MPLHFYDKKAIVATKISEWLKRKEKRKSHITWNELTNSILKEYGFGSKTCTTILEELAPGLTIIDGKAVKK